MGLIMHNGSEPEYKTIKEEIVWPAKLFKFKFDDQPTTYITAKNVRKALKMFSDEEIDSIVKIKQIRAKK